MSASVTEANGLTAYRAGSNASYSALSRVRGSTPNPVYTAVANVGDVTWSDGGAGGNFVLSGAENHIASYTPRNKTQSIIISATDEDNTNTKALAVTGTLPIYPQVGFELELDQDTKVKLARDRTRYFREDGQLEIGWVFAWENRDSVDRTELQQFWADHRKVKQFYLVDSEANIINLVWFNSTFKSAFNGANRYAMSAAFKGIYTDTPADLTPTLIQINCGGYDVGTYASDRFFTTGYTYDFGAALTPDTTGETNPAPNEVYKWCRFDTVYVEYYITGLRSNAAYDLRLHYCCTDTRTVQPVIQGVIKPNVVVPPAGDVVISDYAAQLSDNNGGIRIRINKVVGVNAIITAIQVIEP